MLISAILFSLTAVATEQKELTLSAKCEKRVRDAVTKNAGAHDETFSIQGIKLLYGGSKGGLHFDPVILVRTSDEVDARDFIVIARIQSDEVARRVGCRVKSVQRIAEGLLPEIDGL